MTLRNARSTRRDFLKTTTFAAGVGALGLANFPAPAVAREVGVNSKLNIAHVGITRQGAYSVNGCKGENQIALCDADSKHLDAAKATYPNAKMYQDFRDMLDEMGDQLDAIVVCTPDHTHAAPAIAGMKLGLH
ncbi:MAG: Gfo/Idh/MocA family oxidoreductase, partial [Thermoguttaceae bacterium]|nr:Gfo/Idh/MocA family oxidoreductase [Thermoguttaceae bacterium]